VAEKDKRNEYEHKDKQFNAFEHIVSGMLSFFIAVSAYKRRLF
jgi:hypothetical protein